MDMVTNLLTEGVTEAIGDYLAGGVHVVCQSIDPPWRLSSHARPHQDMAPGPEIALRTMASVRALTAARDDAAFVDTFDDLERALAEGRLSILLHSQTSSQFGSDLDLVSETYAAGLRMSALAYNVRSLAADGCVESSNAGLSRWGRHVVSEMNRVGMIVDGSHVGERSTLEAMDRTETPFVFSHSGCRALHEHPRNITDEQIRRCAATGGVVGIYAIPWFLCGSVQAPIETMVEHVRHAVDVAGIDHVGLAPDLFFGFGGYVDRAWPSIEGPDDGVGRLDDLLWGDDDLPATSEPDRLAGFATAADWPTLTQALLDAGFDEREVRAISGENWVRVMRACWR